MEETEGQRANATDEPMGSADDIEVEREGFSLWKRLRSPRTLISFGIALALIIFAFRGLNIDLDQTWTYMRAANPWLMLLGLAVFYTTFPMRALRWRMLLHNADVPIHQGRGSWASFPALMEYLYLSWFANCIVPAKLGDAYRAYLLKHNGKVSFSSAFGTIFAERLLDMIGLFAMLLVSGWLTFGAHMPEGTQIVFGFGALLVVLILTGLAGMRWLSPLIRRFIPTRLHDFYARFEYAALRSFSPAILPRLVLLTGVIWLLEGTRLYFVILALGHEGLSLGLSAVIFVALASSLLTALPITPAGLGVVEGTVTVVLTFFGVDRHLGVAVTLLDRLINFWSIVVGGFILYLFSKRK
ncbi:lysylphosphatidylglycerol synthase transmembrane domain-containing protein [Candidatus Oscillochloris fontis]|uniref:lysylphosphatidylglycerol synthase transmembrane domain-containing protein n=1 Tax=Candidatus Oscillochloris fontis TaxID=2496868 RepID=UPI001EE84E4F|nr:lysylphosphatidylglycerol synthase transmembrane domain-containing protein [Candidatus Oscillochloris fontis]